MPYTSRAVANYFLERGADEDIPISPMKLQKLVYYGQGWHLGLTGTPLMNEQIECWHYGPVVDTLFHEFKEFGSGPIDRLATRTRYVRRKSGTPLLELKTRTPRIPDDDEDAHEILDTVWDAYKGFSAIKLSNMTHAPGEPWRVIYEEYNQNPPKGTDIPMDLIRDHFKELAEESG